MELELKKLLELQSVDVELIQLSSKRKSIVADLMTAKANIEAKIDQQNEVKVQFEKLEAKRAETQLEITLVQERMTAIKSKQNLVKKNQEYQALTHEIKQADNELQRYTQALTALKTDFESVNQSKTELAEEITTAKAEFNASAQEAKKEIGQIEKELKATKSVRKSLSANIDAGPLAVYEKLMLTRSPRAIVEVCENVCGGCNINLPAQVVGDIMKGDKFVICESCARVLYVKPKSEN